MVQKLFVTLLSDPKSKHLSRESCCLGLAACRGLLGRRTNENPAEGDAQEEFNSRLLRSFGQTTNYGNSALMETQSQAAERREAEGRGEQLMEVFGVENEVGGASGIGEAALGAYREMAGAAVSVGRHDVLYTLLILSVSHPYWYTSAGRENYG